MKRFFALLALSTVLASPSFASFESYIKIKGVKQGQFKPSATAVAHQGTTLLTAFDTDSLVALDSTGQPIGRRRHEPIVIRKEVDQASPMFLRAMRSNELLDVSIDLYERSPDGHESLSWTIVLSNAVVASIAAVTVGAPAHAAREEEIRLNFQKIEINRN